MSHADELLRAKASVRAHLDAGLDVPVRLPYTAWEQAFVERWGFVPLHNGRYAWLYLEQQNLNPLGLNFDEAARAFHVNEFTIHLDQPEHRQMFMRMEDDYDKVKPELPPEKLDLREQTKVMQYDERFNPTPGQKVGRLVFDMHDRPTFRPYWGSGAAPLENPEAGQ